MALMDDGGGGAVSTTDLGEVGQWKEAFTDGGNLHLVVTPRQVRSPYAFGKERVAREE